MHVLEVFEVQDDRPRPPVAGLVVGVHQDGLGERREITLDVYDARLLAGFPDLHLYLGLWHLVPPCPVYLSRSLVLATQAVERTVQGFVFHLRTRSLLPRRSSRRGRRS